MEILSGQRIGLPLVIQIGSIRSDRAQPTQTWHSHPGFEILFVLAGRTAWEFQANPTLEVTGGHFLVIPPNTMHRASQAMRKPSAICGIVFNPALRAAPQNSCFTRKDLRFLLRQFQSSALMPATMNNLLTDATTRLVDLKRTLEKAPSGLLLRAAARSAVCEIILTAAAALSATPPNRGPQALVDAAMRYLRDRLHEPVRMADLSKHMGFGRSYLFSIFKNIAGMTPNDFHVRIRIERAQALLTESDRSITRVAMDTGFSSGQYFSTVFRKHTGQTPATFRKSSRAPTR